MDIRYGRKRKGIVKEIKQKVEDWLSTIDDEELVKCIRNDLILTGGSIASMLLGEKVNDYDFYFRTIETTEKVARYYVDQFMEVHNTRTDDGVLPYTPEVKIEELANIKGETEKRVNIFIKSAGVVSEEQEEYGYFETMGEDDAIDFVESMKELDNLTGKKAYRPTFLSQNAVTLSDNVQLVTRFYGEPDEIHDNYDFVHAMCYYDYHNEHLELPAEALEALMSRTLVYRGSLYPIASIFRMKKFLERGWRITAGQQLKIMWQISEIDLSDYAILREQLTGVDAAYMYQLIQSLKDVDPQKINSSYVGAIIDKIFD